MTTPIEQRRILRTAIPGPASAALHERKLASVSAGVSTGLPAYVVAGQGGILVDADGNQLIDFGSGIAVTSVGNGNQRVIDAVSKQIAEFTHTCFMVNPYEQYVAVAEKLNELTPGSHEKRTALFNSGAEAVENAVKVARHFTGKDGIVAFDHAYHGRTNLTLAMTAKNMPYKHRFGPFASELYRVPMAYPYRWPGGPQHCSDEAFNYIVDQIHAQIGEENTAAVIIEPIQGEGGFIVPPAGFLKELAQWCAANNILFIADEVQSGFCRSGDWFASSTKGSSPTSSPPPRASPEVCRCRGSPGARTSWTPFTPAASAAPTAATRWRAQRPSPQSRRWRSSTWRLGPARSRRSFGPTWRSSRRPTRRSGRSAAVAR